VGTSGGGLGTRKRGMRYIWWMYFVSIYESRELKPVEIVLRRGREKRERWRR
jgi:hypothetical protein